MPRGRRVAGAERARSTLAVPDDVFRRVYESPRSLPGKERWLTVEEDVRTIEHLLGLPSKTIGAPLWVSGDTRRCSKCGRETNWLDIVGSALRERHRAPMIAKVILGEQKYVNVEAPRAIADLHCHGCGASITDLRSFKCHNWAYAVGRLREIVLELSAERRR
jgi:hypothetical protein